MLNKLKSYDIILGSGSPRRLELFQALNIPFEVKLIDIEETYPENLHAEEIPLHLAKQKADAYDNIMQDNTLVITADTIVWLDGKVLGKPTDRADAKLMLETLSGRTHKVITGVCIKTKEKSKTFYTITEVSFSVLDEEEIDYYLDNYAPYDKAGSYGVQEWIGFIGVEKMVGSYFNVMGLPIQKLYKELKSW